MYFDFYRIQGLAVMHGNKLYEWLWEWMRQEEDYDGK